MTMNEQIGSLMRAERKRARMTLDEVAKRMGKTKNTISYLELGKTKITVDDLKAFCNIVGCSWIEILNKVSDED